MYFHTFVMLRVSRLLALGKLQGQGLTQDWKFPHSLLEDVLKQEAKKPSFINKKKKSKRFLKIRVLKFYLKVKMLMRAITHKQHY